MLLIPLPDKKAVIYIALTGFVLSYIYLSKVNLFCLRYDIVRVVPLGLKLLMYKIHQHFYFHH